MTLTENGKKYIAITFGNVSKCYVASGINWSYTGTDSQTYNESGGTAQIVSRLIMTSLVQSVTYNGQNYTYTALKTANDNTDMTLGDVQWIAQNDGAPAGEAQYCSTVSTGSISCTTSPSGASVTLDGVSQGVVTPATLTNVSVGSHTVTFTLSGYNACPVTVTVAAGVTATASCNLTSGIGGSISCTTNPAGASITLDGVSLEIVTPAILMNITPGLHNVTFTLSGYNACSGSVTVIASSIVTASCTMTPVAATGSIRCTTTPSGAPITLDGMNIGMVTPATILNVSAGSHVVMFTLVGYNACPVSVNVAAGLISTANCTLTPSGTCNTPSCKVQMNQ